MKHLPIILLLLLQSCSNKTEMNSLDSIDWDAKVIKTDLDSALIEGSTYLSAYSQIYSQTEHRTHNLTITVSMRNTNITDTIFIKKADYFNTEGHLIRSYIEKTIFVLPMETIEIVIDERDQEGGTGANFLFEWAIKEGSYQPYFEAIMISTSGQQGLSFSTQGRNIR